MEPSFICHLFHGIDCLNRGIILAEPTKKTKRRFCVCQEAENLLILELNKHSIV
jgi:hypothetical protein